MRCVRLTSILLVLVRALVPASVPALALVLTAGCGPPVPHDSEVQVVDPLSIRLNVVEALELEVVQVGGGAEVDYIIDSLGAGAAWLDYDGDGDADLYLAQGATPESPYAGPPDRLLRNDGDPDGDGVPTFVYVTQDAGLGDTMWSFGVAVADYDNDGDPDIYLCNFGTNRLYRNNGDGSFTEVGRAAGVAGNDWSTSAVWSDVDRDGDLDLYTVNYVVFDIERYPSRGELLAGGRPPCVWKGLEVFCGPRNLEAAPDRFYRNDGDPDGDGVPLFVDATREAGLELPEPYFGLAGRFFDGDGDGDDDLYVANDSVQNLYFVNDGSGRFEELSILAGLAYNEQGNEQAGMGIATGDYDTDGRIDLVVSNFSHDHDTLYRNDGEQIFTDVSYRAGIGSPSFLALGWGVGLLDLDQDGWQDLLVARGHVYPQVDGSGLGTRFRQLNGLYHNLGDGTFEPIENGGDGLQVAESSRALLETDIDGDGDLDVLITNRNAAPLLLRNDGVTGNWLQVRLIGTESNRDGIGARLTLAADAHTQVREIRRGASYAGSVLPVAHFGLGETKETLRLEVRWPSGRQSVLRDLKANQLLTVEESGGE